MAVAVITFFLSRRFHLDVQHFSAHSFSLAFTTTSKINYISFKDSVLPSISITETSSVLWLLLTSVHPILHCCNMFLLWHSLIPPTDDDQISKGKFNIFQLICSLHLHPAHSGSIGFCFVLQTRPVQSAFYPVSFRWTELLLSASFRFHLTMDTLAVQLTLPTTKRVRDLHPIDIKRALRTKREVA